MLREWLSHQLITLTTFGGIHEPSITSGFGP